MYVNVNTEIILMARPAKLSRQHIQQAALMLADQQGVAQLSIRALAKQLNTAPMTLYNYVSTREEIDLLVVDAVVSEINLTLDEEQNWQDALRTVAVRAWLVFREHPKVVPLILTRRSQSRAVQDFSEVLLNILVKSGRQEAQLLYAFRAVTAVITGVAQTEFQTAVNTGSELCREQAITDLQKLSDSHPRLSLMASGAAQVSEQQEFAGALDIILRGLN